MSSAEDVELAELRVMGSGSEIDPSVAARLVEVLNGKVVEVIHEALPDDMAAKVEGGLRRELESDERTPWSVASLAEEIAMTDDDALPPFHGGGDHRRRVRRPDRRS